VSLPGIFDATGASFEYTNLRLLRTGAEDHLGAPHRGVGAIRRNDGCAAGFPIESNLTKTFKCRIPPAASQTGEVVPSASDLYTKQGIADQASASLAPNTDYQGRILGALDFAGNRADAKSIRFYHGESTLRLLDSC